MSKANREHLEIHTREVELSNATGYATEVFRVGLKTSVQERWCMETREYCANSFPDNRNPKMTDEQREIAELKKRLRNVELERDILKKAIAIYN